MFNFVTYMRNLAEKNKDIQHSEHKSAFHRITNLATLEELLSNMREVDGYQMMVEDVMEGRFEESGSALLDIPTFRFYILKNVKTQDWDDKEEAKRLCKILAKKIIAKIRKDNYDDASFETSYGLKDLDRNSFQYFSIGPLLDNFWGVEISFIIQEGSGIKYDADDWLT